MTRLSLVALLAAPWFMLPGLVSADAVADLEKQGRPSIDAQIAQSATCTQEKLQVRREW